MRYWLYILILSIWFGSSADAATLKIATLAPDGTNWMKLFRQAAGEIKQQTTGRVTIRFFPGGVMGNDKSVMRKIRIGQLHGGAVTGGSLGKLYPAANLYSLPFQFRNLLEVDAVRERMDQQILAGLNSAGFISFGLSEGGFAYLLSNTPVQATDDLKGLKIWIPEDDQINAVMFQELDVTPIQLPLTDVMTGLQTGLINTIASSPIGAIALQWHSRVKYLTQVPLAYLYGALIIDKKAFKRLHENDRATVTSIMQNTFATLNRQNRQDNKNALQALQQQGIEVIQPSLAQQQGWEQHANKQIDALYAAGKFRDGMLKQMQKLIQAQRLAKTD